MFKDEHRVTVWEAIGQRDLQAFSQLFGREHVVEAARRAGVAIGGGPLTVVTLAWLSISSDFALQQELCRRAGGHAEAALRSARLVAVGFGPSSQTQGREIGQETQATQSAKHVVVFAQRRGVYPSAPAFAVVVLGVPVVGAQRTIRGTTPRTRELEGFSAADDGRLARGVAAMEVFGRLLRHDQQRQTDANAASADGDAGAGADPVCLCVTN